MEPSAVSPQVSAAPVPEPGEKHRACHASAVHHIKSLPYMDVVDIAPDTGMLLVLPGLVRLSEPPGLLRSSCWRGLGWLVLV